MIKPCLGLLTMFFLLASVMAQNAKATGLLFSHELHVVDEELDCLDCHPDNLVPSSEVTTDRLLPSEEACMQCHDNWAEEGSCKNCHQGEQPYFSRILPPAKFMFSHARHLTQAKLNCEVCHSDMNGITEIPPVPNMTECIRCHLKKQAPIDCQDCHKASTVLRPQDHTPYWIQDHDVAALTSSTDCLQCHVQITCDNCHSGSKLGGDDFKILDPMSIMRKDLGGDKLALDRVHDLNYKYFHGLDADTKAYDCGTCHEVQTFCTDCHNNEANPLMNKPAFHGGQDWGVVSYPNGTDFSNDIDGGEHARLARMDIERCQSCHDIEGADPICVRCHNDIDGVQFTDPKTHVPGFMSDVNGDWHKNEASLCYVCHTKEQEGQGFCVYCHQ